DVVVAEVFVHRRKVVAFDEVDLVHSHERREIYPIVEHAIEEFVEGHGFGDGDVGVDVATLVKDFSNSVVFEFDFGTRRHVDPALSFRRDTDPWRAGVETDLVLVEVLPKGFVTIDLEDREEKDHEIRRTNHRQHLSAPATTARRTLDQSGNVQQLDVRTRVLQHAGIDIERGEHV